MFIIIIKILIKVEVSMHIKNCHCKRAVLISMHNTRHIHLFRGDFRAVIIHY